MYRERLYLRHVTLLEKNSTVGGRARMFKEKAAFSTSSTL
jgi:phytoene dehydrogenase-like protein